MRPGLCTEGQPSTGDGPPAGHCPRPFAENTPPALVSVRRAEVPRAHRAPWSAGAVDDDRPTQAAPAPWEVPPPWLVEAEASNPAARWALGLGVASVVPGVGLGAVAAGVLGLVRARARRGAGRGAAAVGLALGAAFLLLDVGVVGVGAVHAVTAGSAAPSGPADGSSGGSGALPDPDDRTSADLSSAEQAFIDAVDDVTYLNFNDETLLAMGREACTDFAAGRTPQQDADRLNDHYGAGTGDARDVQRAATSTFCPDSAGSLSGSGGGTTT